MASDGTETTDEMMTRIHYMAIVSDDHTAHCYEIYKKYLVRGKAAPSNLHTHAPQLNPKELLVTSVMQLCLNDEHKYHLLQGFTNVCCGLKQCRRWNCSKHVH